MTDRTPPTSDQPSSPPPPRDEVAIDPPRNGATPTATWLDEQTWETARGHRRTITPHMRDAALGHAIWALGDSAITHDGYFRPRVWELADQAAAYIRDGSRPDDFPPHCTHTWYGNVYAAANADMPPDRHSCTAWTADHPGACRCCCGATTERTESR